LKQGKVYTRKELEESHKDMVKEYGFGFLRVLDIAKSEYALFASINNFDNNYAQSGVGTLFDEAGEIYDANPLAQYYFDSFIPIRPK